MRNYSLILLLLIGQLLVVSAANAAENILKNSLDKLGVMSTINRPGVVNDQLGGYMTGGSLHTRNSVSDETLMNIQLPSLNAGCGGIDLHTGGIGYIDSA